MIDEIMIENGKSAIKEQLKEKYMMNVLVGVRHYICHKF